MSAIMDPTFEHHLVVGRVWAEIALALSDSLIIPINCKAYAERMRSSVTVLKTNYEAKMAARPNPITFGEQNTDDEEQSRAVHIVHIVHIVHTVLR